jgi:hypothetical protein
MIDRLRVFENTVLRAIYGRQKYGVGVGWRKLRNEELQNFHSSPNIIKGKGKVVHMLFFLTEHYAMKAYWESGGIAPHILDGVRGR